MYTMSVLNYLKLAFLITVQFAVGQSTLLEKECRNFKYEVKLDNGKALLNHVIGNVTIESDVVCRVNCFIKPDCVSYNLGPSPTPGMLLCELNNAVRYQYPQDYHDKPGFSHRGVLENKCAANPCKNNGTCYHGYGAEKYLCICKPGIRGKNCENELGGSAISPAKSCFTLKQEVPSLPSGVYWIDLGDPSNPFLSYCDMETDGGGWTLSWAYTFIFYKKNYNSKSNALIPGPKNLGLGVISDTPPQNETDYNAIDFTKWKLIGSEILIKSNINNWFSCKAGTGSFVTKTAGNMDCRMIKQITSICSVVPNYFKVGKYGCSLSLDGSGFLYYWVTSTTKNWPAHDPCSTIAQNHLKNIPNPHGNIYVR